MSKYTIMRDLALLNAHELIEVLEQELARRIQKNKEELELLEKVLPVFEKQIKEILE